MALLPGAASAAVRVGYFFELLTDFPQCCLYFGMKVKLLIKDDSD